MESPQSFGKTPIAYIPLTDSEAILGRVVETTLYDLVKQDIQDHTKKLFFKVDSVDGNKASSTLKGYEYSREYLRSLIRRGSTTIACFDDCTTKDGIKVRVFVIALAQGRINTSRKHAVRLITSKILREKASDLTYDQFIQEAVLGKIASDIYNNSKRITQLRHVGIRKTKLLEGAEGRPGEEADEITAQTDELEESLEEAAPAAA